MAETQADKTQTLAEQYSLEKEEKPDVGTMPVEAKVVENPGSFASEEVVSAKPEETPAAAEESSEVTPAASEIGEASPTATSEETNPATETSAEESSDSAENSGDLEAAETPEIKIETAPADFRFPTTNQTRHCFTRYVEYHRCIAAKGEGAPECERFAKYYRSLCPGEWVERWNEQRENGTFPGPL